MQQMKSNRGQATALMLMSATSFCLMSMVVKLSATTAGTLQQVFFRNLVSLIAVGAVIWKKKLPFLGKKQYQPTLCARSLFGFIGVIMLFYATANARQADIAILSRTSPIWTTIFAALILKEKISKVQVPVIVLCFAGTVVAMQPAFDSNILPLLLAAATAVCSGLAYTIIAFCKGKVHPLTVIFHFSLFSTVAGFFLMLPTFTMPTFQDVIMLILIGVFAAGGQIGLTFAYQKAPASEVSIYDYVGIVVSMLIGQLVFSEPLTASSVLGAVLITSSALWSYWYNHRHGEN